MADPAVVGELAGRFPLVVAVIVVVIVVLTFRLDRRMSRGAYSAGPLDVVEARPPGQERTPWELRAIEDQLQLAMSAGTSAVPRYDLAATVNRLISAAGLPDDVQLPVTADLHELNLAITRIEQRLELPPLTESRPEP